MCLMAWRTHWLETRLKPSYAFPPLELELELGQDDSSFLVEHMSSKILPAGAVLDMCLLWVFWWMKSTFLME